MNTPTLISLAALLVGCGARTELLVDEQTADSAVATTDTFVADTSLIDTFAPPPDTLPVEDTRDVSVFPDVPDDVPIVVPATAAKEIVTGGDTTCVLTAGGRVRCFGTNGSGQLGDGTMTARTVPTPPIALEGVAQIAVADQVTCARMADGTVSCFGQVGYGLLGTSAPITPAMTPRQVGGLADIVDIAIGGFGACGVRRDGALLCWGGCDTEGPGPCTSVPRVVIDGGVAQVVASPRAKCVRLTNGEVSCWGNNVDGVLGDGTVRDRETPAPVPGLTDVVAIAMGGSFFGPFVGMQGSSVCALKKDGSVWCWGTRQKDGRPLPVNRPERVDGLTFKPVRIATHGPLSCALGDDARVACWGFSARGGFGIPDGFPWESAREVAVPPSVAIAVGADRACAVGADGLPRCWGAPLIGDGTTLERRAPSLVVW